MKRAWLIPEVLQSSHMDCGPAALKAVLEGFGVSVHYDELRERCATDVDGTSIDALAALGAEFGLKSHELLVSRDSLLLPEASCLPAIVVTRAAGGLLHFIVVWNAIGPFVQILDPSSGRQWLSKRRFLELMPDLPVSLSSTKWRRWAGSQRGRAPLLERMRGIGLTQRAAAALLDLAALDPSWCSFATLDAGVRMLQTLVGCRAVGRGADAQRLLRSLLDDSASLACGVDGWSRIPPRFWWARADARDAAALRLLGCVVVHFEAGTSTIDGRATGARRQRLGTEPEVAQLAPNPSVPAALQRELERTVPRPMWMLWKLGQLRSGRLLAWLAIASLAAAFVVIAEALVLRSMLGVDRYLRLDYQRGLGIVAALGLVGIGLWLEFWSEAAVRRIGRGLELRLRVLLLEKLPRLADSYLRTRPTSDMAARGHAIHHLREVPELWARTARSLLLSLTTGAGLCWLYPEGSELIAGLLGAAVLMPYAARRGVMETSTRLRTHASALDRFYLDAMLGAAPVRVHGAERTVRTGHEQLLTEWVRTARALLARSSGLQALTLLSNTGLSLALVVSYVQSGGASAGLLLLAYWVWRLAAGAQELVSAQFALRQLRSVALRLLAPLAAPDGTPAARAATCSEGSAAPRVVLHGVTVQSGGSTLLHELDLDLPARSHVAIVGPSGAGKSSLLGLLLGWLSPSEGVLRIDGRPLDASQLAQLRERTAWVDPAVRLWEGSLHDNLLFGDDEDVLQRLPEAMARADLLELLECLPDGLRANVGEGGARLSGGQGQRVRLGRALMRKRAGLVLLDEPFRGLEREKRRDALHQVRAHFRHATLLFVSHDVSDALEFDRVLVLSDGKIVEDGAPRALLEHPGSQYRRLVDAERALRERLWSSANWRRYVLRSGRATASEVP